MSERSLFVPFPLQFLLTAHKWWVILGTSLVSRSLSTTFSMKQDECAKETVLDKLYYILVLVLMLIYTLINKGMEKKGIVPPAAGK